MATIVTPVAGTGTAVSATRSGMILVASASLMAPATHAIAKGLGDSLSSGQIAWARFLFQLAFLLPLVLFSHRGRLPRPSFTHGLRGGLLALGTLSFFWAVTFMPLADSAAIFFVLPLILTLMAAIFLGEPIGWRRIAAVITGFAGSLIVIRPRFESVGLPATLPLLAALCFALYLTMTRGLAKTEDGRVAQFWVCVFAMLILSAALNAGGVIGIEVLRPRWPTMQAWGWLGALGLIATLSHMLAILAFRRAPAGALAPFQYLEILGATLFGAILFNDVPDRLTLLGIAIIVGSGLYVFSRERKAGIS